MAIKKTKTSSSQKNLSIEKVKTASHQQSTPTREVNTSSVEKKLQPPVAPVAIKKQERILTAEGWKRSQLKKRKQAKSASKS
jgi:hypothetical protein